MPVDPAQFRGTFAIGANNRTATGFDRNRKAITILIVRVDYIFNLYVVC